MLKDNPQQLWDCSGYSMEMTGRRDSLTWAKADLDFLTRKKMSTRDLKDGPFAWTGEEEPGFCPKTAPRVLLRPTTPMERKCLPANYCTLTILCPSLSCQPTTLCPSPLLEYSELWSFPLSLGTSTCLGHTLWPLSS